MDRKDSNYVSLAGLVALLTAGFLLLARLLKLGFLADFLSRTVLIGFLSGVADERCGTRTDGSTGVVGVLVRVRSLLCKH